jgi:hypothetical protein
MVVFDGMLVASAFVHSFGLLLYCIIYSLSTILN